MFTVILLIITVVIFAVWKLYKRTFCPKYPPGPRGIPIFGNLFQVGNHGHLKFQEWSKKYGNIFSIQLGKEKIIVLTDHKLMKEMLSQTEFSGRPQSEIFIGLSQGSYGIINAEGEAWEAQRRFTLRHLRDFGFGKNYMESLIIEEAKEFVDWLKSEEGHPVSVNRKLSLAVLNSLWSITSGRRFPQNDPTLTKMLDTATETFNELVESGGLLIFTPWIRHIAPGLSGWNKVQAKVNEMASFFKTTVEEHKTTFQSGHIRDFVDDFISAIETTTDTHSSFYKDNGYKNLVATVGDIFFAGSETTSNTLAWAILYITGHPSMQKKLQSEIDKVIGKSRSPSLSDRLEMPYTEAVIMEILRKSSLVPNGVFHRALSTKEFNGYIIPKGTWIIANLYSVHHNVDIWGDPENFRPERFMSSDGKTVQKHEALIPFQVGKRICLGEPLARDTIFLFLTSIFQRFNITPDTASPKFDYRPQLGMILTAKKFHVLMKDRWE